ncbi:MAG: hypothetical protein FWF20_04690 [Betaproteobacteria bacterium]|nr:hypothetical protein [Betaproteobacteria bacterium]MCL2886075.1 hypothetical protein [Betaproteobacteria bacterium]
MPRFDHAADAFGDPFSIDDLMLPRPATGYAVQMLGSDQLLDRHSGDFLPVRAPGLAALFDSFAAARQAAASWVDRHCQRADEHRLAIVPASFDSLLERHVLICGVLEEQP